jgi:hypothetical protein
MLIGYMRVSSADERQSVDLQRRADRGRRRRAPPTPGPGLGCARRPARVEGLPRRTAPDRTRAGRRSWPLRLTCAAWKSGNPLGEATASPLRASVEQEGSQLVDPDAASFASTARAGANGRWLGVGGSFRANAGGGPHRAVERELSMHRLD